MGKFVLIFSNFRVFKIFGMKLEKIIMNEKKAHEKGRGWIHTDIRIYLFK